ncbi:hypothetical protein J7426_22885 [Tropicibacter sp. R16_0]|uniref:tetratricopeptide repeat protein n=1 Tax=Tropicibacter sp. R16_0 TaxID=2821102 RepID=UPI001ADAB7C1|nr:hypothetical protein [Tropicibacter sp. R16_0]MBO9453126.1 hypothetical protein [Tropicibacter sp. R16_0]
MYETEAFSNSPRLQDFLSFVVTEVIEGRGEDIKGKSIAVQVYQREIDEAGNAQNLVSVEARRLRRALEEYYANEGRDEQLIIRLDTGGYKPRIERRSTPEADAKSENELETRDATPIAKRTRDWRLYAGVGVAFAALLVIAVVSFSYQRTDVTPAVVLNENARLAALRERSFKSVQSANIADQARGQFFPLFDPARQQINLKMFRHAIELDPQLPDGYAGSAQVLALLSLLSPEPDLRAELLDQAFVAAETAIEIAPADGWSNAAMGLVLAVSGDNAAAVRRSKIAESLPPQNGHSLDLIGLTGILVGDAELAAQVSDPTRPRTGSGRFAYSNIWGVSQLMLGNYRETADTYAKAANNGAPVSGPTLMLMATALNEMGETEGAIAAVKEMRDTWPEFRAQAVATRFFNSDPGTMDKVIRAIQLVPATN